MRDLSLGKVIRKVKHLLAPEMNNLSGVDYWKQRVNIYGGKSVLNVARASEDMESVNRWQKEQIFPYLQQMLRGDENLVLDFGCGPGRFTHDLAQLTGGKAIGVDPISKLLELAPNYQDVEYRVMEEGKIPLSDECVDVVWVCLVLGGITDKEVLQQTTTEINRIMKKDGLLFVVENTSEQPDSNYWAFRQVSDYQKMLSFASLTHLHDYLDLGECISIMGGRKQ